ncbi:MAG: glycosyltransferase, partial [Chitinophagaceae bacterium]
INYGFIERYNQCWVPDNLEDNGIAGLLSHPQKMPKIPTHYVGVLSRFQQAEQMLIKYNVCVLLSGPEPQRTILENMLLRQIQSSNLKILFVRGLPNAHNEIHSTAIEIKNHLTQNQLQQAICSSNIIIARSGYTTVMELLALKKKAILIPTPGQTEQEYLAKHLQNQNKCLAFKQYEFDFNKAIKKAKNYEFNLASTQLFNEQNIIDLVNELL